MGKGQDRHPLKSENLEDIDTKLRRLEYVVEDTHRARNDSIIAPVGPLGAWVKKRSIFFLVCFSARRPSEWFDQFSQSAHLTTLHANCLSAFRGLILPNHV